MLDWSVCLSRRAGITSFVYFLKSGALELSAPVYLTDASAAVGVVERVKNSQSVGRQDFDGV